MSLLTYKRNRAAMIPMSGERSTAGAGSCVVARVPSLPYLNFAEAAP